MEYKRVVICAVVIILLKINLEGYQDPNVKDTYQIIHYENMPMQYTEIFKVVKNEKNQ